MYAASMLVDVMLSIVRAWIIDEALLNRHHILASRQWLLVD